MACMAAAVEGDTLDHSIATVEERSAEVQFDSPEVENVPKTSVGLDTTSAEDWNKSYSLTVAVAEEKYAEA